MKLQNIFALIVTLIGFAACTSESELPDTPVSGDLVPVTISLGSIQTKASVGLDTDEGIIQNAVIGIFDSNGIPTVAPIVLKGGTNSGTTRLPLIKSNAYAFVNVSQEDIAALKAKGSEQAFKDYAITKELTQDAAALPKYGMKTNFTPTANENIAIDVHQMTARLETMVNLKVYQNGTEIANPGLSFSMPNVLWTNMSFQSTAGTQTDGLKGPFTTTINGTPYTTLNRAYTYPNATPSISLMGSVIESENETVDGFKKQVSLSYTFPESLKADNVYLVRFIVKVDITQPANPTLTYEVIPMSKVEINVPSFN